MSGAQAVERRIARLIAERDEARRERDDYRALFDLQWTRTQEATALWQAEDPEARSHIMPDLGELLAWLMERYDKKGV